MSHIKNKNLSLRDADEAALDHARRLQAALSGIRLEEEDDDEEEEEDDDEEEEDDDDDDDDVIDDTPMSAEEAVRVRKALKKANAEAARYRTENKELRQQNETEQERAIREAKEAAAKDVEGEWRSKFLKSEAKTALLEAGLTKGIKKFVGLVDFDEVEVDDEGNVSGLDDQVKELKDEFPDLFEDDGKRRKHGVGGGADGAAKKSSNGKPKTSAEKIAASIQS